LACGALAAERVAAVITVCSVSGPGQTPSLDPQIAELARAFLADAVAARDAVRDRAHVVLGDSTLVTRMTEQFDPRVYDAPGMREIYQANWDEASAVSVEGYVDDWILDVVPWPFSLRDVSPPVFAWLASGTSSWSPGMR
jgi:hypothetical protein